MQFKCVVLALMFGVSASSSPAAEVQSFSFRKSFPAASSSALDVRTTNGKITVTVGAGDTIDVRGTATVKAGFNVPADAVDLARSLAASPPIRQDGRTLRLEPPPPAIEPAVTLAYEVTIPATLNVRSSSDSGETRITGVAGTLDVHTQSAAIALASLGGKVTCTTGSGDVDVSGTTSDISITTASSAISARDLGAGLKVDTGSGSVDATFRGKGDADIRTNSSAITVSGLNGGLKATTGSGRVIVEGTPVRDWFVTTSSSAIDARVPAAVGLSLDLTSRSGSVKVDGAAVHGTIDKRRVRGDVAGGGPTVHLQSGSGALHVIVGVGP
jgi:DUF4097 and DUF4098 domain-containing protein YvlB